MQAATAEQTAPVLNAQTRHAPKQAVVDAGRWNGRRMSPTIGLEVSGISLGEDFSDADIAQLRALLVRHKVLVFRAQDITAAQHVALAARFGALEQHSMLNRHPDHPELVTFVHDGNGAGAENRYHSDTSFLPVPSMGSMLRCVECPEVGGDTIFVNMVDAYEQLPEAIKQRLDGLYAVHDASVVFGQRGLKADARAKMRSEHPPVEHPVVRTHPESGEKILFVNETFSTHFANFRSVHQGDWHLDGPTHTRDLFDTLVRQAYRPEYQVRIRWDKNTVVFWDNRSTQHYAISDYFPNLRSMARATIIGDVPV